MHHALGGKSSSSRGTWSASKGFAYVCGQGCSGTLLTSHVARGLICTANSGAPPLEASTCTDTPLPRARTSACTTTSADPSAGFGIDQVTDWACQYPPRDFGEGDDSFFKNPSAMPNAAHLDRTVSTGVTHTGKRQSRVSLQSHNGDRANEQCKFSQYRSQFRNHVTNRGCT